ncbi:glycoside hydrolase domain-containing protein [Tenuibacillus multivorans]|nr:glycoside hydrolase domain-containing protein [Tenuibacillus multivorans]GEL76425.1 hypothetical protein TMU01_06600 [Tenuibacillus multivorans]
MWRSNWVYEIFTIIAIIALFAIPLILYTAFGNGDDEDSDTSNQSEIIWGVDSASYTDENMYACVTQNFGEPEVWGRYLGDREDVSVGLDSNEVDYLHQNDISILLIYNHVNEAVGYDHGIEHAKQAIQYAKNLGVPEGVALFVDIEPSYPVDSVFIEGWYDQLAESAYYPGIYGVFDGESELDAAYQDMKNDVQQNTIVWSAYPQLEVTTKENAPDYQPQAPDNAMAYGWQYAIDADTCNIDTNLFKSELIDFLW